MEENNKLAGHNSFGTLLKFTWPMILMMVVINIYCIVDGLFISNLVGSDAFSAVNLVMPFAMLFGSVGFMIGTGGTAIVARCLGMKENEKASKIFSMLVEFNFLSGILLLVIGELLLEPVMMAMGAKDETLKNTLEYGRILVGMIPFLMLQYSFQSFLGVAGKGKVALVLTIASGVTNMLFDFLFVYVFQFGLSGAAWASTFSWLVGSVIPIVYFIVSKNLPIRLRFSKLDFKCILKSCYNGLSEMLSSVSLSIANIIFDTELIKLYDGKNDGVFALGIIMYISYIFAGVYMGYAMGASQKVAYNYGAGDMKEVDNINKKTFLLIFIGSVILTGASIGLSYPFTYIFVQNDQALLDLSAQAMMKYSFVFLISGYNVYASSFFTALGNGTISGIISLLKSLVFQVPMIFILPLINKDLVWFSVSVSETLTLIVSVTFMVRKQKKYGYHFFAKD